MADDDAGDLDQDDLDDLGDLGDDDDGPDDEADEGNEGDDTPGKGKADKDWKPPTRAEWERAQRRLKRYSAERRGGSDPDRKLLDQLNGKGGKDDDEDGNEDRAEAARWRTAAARGQAAAQLSAAGFNGSAKQAARLTRLIDLEGAKPDRDGQFDFEDDIEDLKDDYPELFGAKGSRRNERQTPDRGPGPNRERQRRQDPTQRTTAALLKEAGFR